MGVLEGQAAGRRIRATGCAEHPCEGPHFKYDRPVDARNEVAENLRLGQVQHEECADPVRANEGNGGVPAQGGRDLRSNLWVRSKRLRKNRLNWGGGPLQRRVMHMPQLFKWRLPIAWAQHSLVVG